MLPVPLDFLLRRRLPAAGRTLQGLLILAMAVVATPSALAVVKFSDGFGDADLNNNGIALEFDDVDVNTNDELGTYVPGRLLDGSGTEPTNNEVTSVLDAGDVGLRWLQIRGFTGANQGDPKPTARIVDDSQGAMVETAPSGPGSLGVAANNDGYAMSYNSRGRGSVIAGFFDENVALGPQAGDSVKVSFDFRIWRDANTANTVAAPEDAELRFGLFQDTDHQLGMSNPVAGRAVDDGSGFLTPTPAIWGQEEGWFEGGQITGTAGSDIGSPGDAGWFGAVIIEDPNGQFPPITPNGGGWRIREETNLGANADKRLMQGQDTDTVALPHESSPGLGDYGLTNLDVNKVWRLSLELIRATEATPGDTITAVLTAVDITSGAPGASYTLMDTEPLMKDDGLGGMIPDGISSDSWDYFAIRNTGVDDFDFIMDNFKLEIAGSNAVVDNADFNGDGNVDSRDFLTWQRGAGSAGGLAQGDANGDNFVDGADLTIWKSQYGTSSAAPAVAGVPEPAGLVLAGVALAVVAGLRRRGLPRATS